MNALISGLSILPPIWPVRRAIRSLTRHASPDQPIRTLDGVRVYCTGDWLQRLAIAGEYEPETIAALRPYANHTVIDVGAHQGLTALRFAQTAQAVIACEPNPSNLRRLTANCHANPQLPVQIVPAAIGDRCGSVTFHLPPDGDGAGSLFPFEARHQATQFDVPLQTLDSLTSPGRVSLIKIDVQGAELEVLRGASCLIGQDRPALCFEICLTIWAERSASVTELLDLVTGYGYALHQIQPNGTLTAFTWLKDRVDNIVALPTTRTAARRS